MLILRQYTRNKAFCRSFSNYFHSGVHVNPHPAKVHKGGEDAFAITKDN